MVRRAAAACLVLLPLLGACSKNEGIVDRVELQPFESCDALLDYLRDAAVQEYDSSHEEATNRSTGGIALASASEDKASAPQAPGSFTTTNTQVEGVDEADFVKNDGERIYFLTGRTLRVVKSWPARESAVLATVAIEGWPSEMFLAKTPAGKRLVVFSGTTRVVVTNALTPEPPNPDGDPSKADMTKVTLLDVSSDVPVVAGAWYLPGRYASARMVDGSVRIVLSGDVVRPAEPEVEQGTSWLSGSTSGARRRSAYEEVVRTRKVEEWLPGAYVRRTGALERAQVDCGSFYRPNAPVRLGLATVATLDLSNPTGAIATTTVVGSVGRVYSSAAALYVASPHWWYSFEDGQMDYTYLHKFDLSEKDRVAYVASGGAPGRIVDQFSMDEDKGFLRIATTGMQGNSIVETPESQNRVWVLRENAGRLEVAGRTPPVAQGETMMASRFFGPRGFLVTYLRIDPLFTLDLSDPADPKVVGRLEVPGISTYLNRLDDTHLVTIGESDGRTVELKVFDVGDMASPKVLATQTLGTVSGTSEALHEHKAFNWYPERNLLAIPFTDYASPGAYDPWGSFRSQLRVFRVTAAFGIEPLGSVDHRDLYQNRQRSDWDWGYQPDIRRSVMATGSEQDDHVYSISDAGMKVHALGSLAGTPEAVVAWP